MKKIKKKNTANKSIQTNKINEETIKHTQDEIDFMKLHENSYLVNKWVNNPNINAIKQYCCKAAGMYYCIVHSLFMVLIGLIVFFVTNKTYLCMTLLVISLDGISNILFYDCPLSSLEKKYLNTSMIETRLQGIQKYGMMYANNRIYDTQLEVIINGWTMCAAKILVLIVFDWFHISY